MLAYFAARVLAPIIHNSRSSINQNLREKGSCATTDDGLLRILPITQNKGKPNGEFWQNPIVGSSPHFSVRRERRRSSVGAIPTRQLSLQPVAIGAVVKAMKPLKPPTERVTKGDSASTQAVMRVNAEQASKRVIREPTWLRNREGRWCWDR
jgi:hypothetical protein